MESLWNNQKLRAPRSYKRDRINSSSPSLPPPRVKICFDTTRHIFITFFMREEYHKVALLIEFFTLKERRRNLILNFFAHMLLEVLRNQENN